MLASHSATANGGATKTKLPPFLKKLADLTNSCPPHIGGWSEDGSTFVVKSSQFADLIREQFKSSLQTFVRQLHFYSFNKKDDGAKGIWVFSHPSFLRGQPHLLVNIARKSNPKKPKKEAHSDEEDSAPVHSSSGAHTLPSRASSGSSHENGNSSLEGRLLAMEKKLDKMIKLELEIEQIKKELVEFRELAAAQNLLSLAPGSERSKKRSLEPMKGEENMKEEILVTSKAEKDDPMLNLLPPPAKVTRMTSVDSMFELKDFPFEDTSSTGSTSVRDLMRELQFGIFADFDEFLPSKTADVPQTPSNTVQGETTVLEVAPLCREKECFSIPHNFQLQPGVTIPLLKQAFSVIAKLCCPKETTLHSSCAESLRKLCDELPAPHLLPPVEICPISQQLLPILRENVEDEATDLALMRAARQVYEVYFQTIKKKMQDKLEAPPAPPHGYASKVAYKSAQ